MQAGTKLGRLRMRTQAHPTPELSPSLQSIPASTPLAPPLLPPHMPPLLWGTHLLLPLELGWQWEPEAQMKGRH